MCRYATTHYKKHYACFECRKAFKRRNKDDVDPEGEGRPARCPQCRLLMADMGLDFAPPRSSDAKGWAAAAALHDVGETFHSCGCGGPGYRPRDRAQLAAFFELRKREYAQHLDAWLATHPESPAQAANREAAIATWRSRIDRLEAARATRPA